MTGSAAEALIGPQRPIPGFATSAVPLIADYFPPHRRAAAVGYYAMGVTLGTVVANLIGGPVTDAFGWRWAFFLVGLPGLVIAFVYVITVQEPPRGHCDRPGTCPDQRPTFREGLRELSGKASFWWTTAGCTIASFCGYGIVSFQSLFINRSFGLSTGQASLLVNVPVQTACALGTLATGWLAARLAPRTPTAVAWIPALGMILSVPVYLVGFSTGNLLLCVVTLCFGGFIKYGYLVPQYTIPQGVVSTRFRAVSTAITLFVINLIGYGLGPLFIGAVSDILFKRQVGGLGAADLTRQMCESKTADLSAALADICKVAHPESLQDALLIMSGFYALGGLCLLVACRTLRKDTVSA